MASPRGAPALELPNGKRSIRLSGFSDYTSKMAIARENVPLMPATIKLWAGQFPLKFRPTAELPMKDLEPLNVVAQIRHVFGGKNLIWRMGEGVGDMHGT